VRFLFFLQNYLRKEKLQQMLDLFFNQFLKQPIFKTNR